MLGSHDASVALYLPMITQTGVSPSRAAQASGSAKAPQNARQRLFWTLGNLLMFSGLYLLLYVGGLYTQIEYQRLAARGDNNIAPPQAIMDSFTLSEPIVDLPVSLPVYSVPHSNSAPSNQQITSEPPEVVQVEHRSTVERLVIPSIALDSKVIEVGWDTQEINGQLTAIWNVAEYAVGQHRGSANPGEGGNIVMAGHVGGYGQVFRDLFYVHVGDQMTIYSDGQEYTYMVKERLIVDEDKAPPEQRAENAKLIGPTEHEMVTMVTCWPPTGPDKFTQRVIIRAVPLGSASPDTDTQMTP